MPKKYVPYGSRKRNIELHPGAYQSWSCMLDRCTPGNNQTRNHPHYIGITVCERWKTFENFLEDMGDRPLERSIDRIDHAKPYEPGNCRWSTKTEQAENRRKWRHTADSLAKLHLNFGGR